MTPWAAARGLVPVRRTLRIGVTGLARAGKTALLTSLGANLLAAGRGIETLPALSAALGGRGFRVALSPSGAEALPRFDVPAHLAALAADPPVWPARTEAVSLLSLDVEIGWAGAMALLPPARLRLEFLDYPGEWLVDLPMLGMGFAEWSAATLRRLAAYPEAAEALAFIAGLPPRAPSDEALARTGHDLYRAALRRLRAEAGLSMLQPGKLLMPPPGPAPPWLTLFPYAGSGGLADLLAERYAAYQEAVCRDLLAPGFAEIERLIVLADMLTALHAGPAAFADAAAALAAVSGALRWRGGWTSWISWLAPLLPGFAGIQRVAYAASKSDHVGERQRGNLASLVRAIADPPAEARAFAIASMRCTEDITWSLEGRPVSAVRGRVRNGQAAKSYPGEVPDRLPDASFWEHEFLSLPDFEPLRLPSGGRLGVPHVDLDRLLLFLLEDLL